MIGTSRRRSGTRYLGGAAYDRAFAAALADGRTLNRYVPVGRLSNS